MNPFFIYKSKDQNKFETANIKDEEVCKFTVKVINLLNKYNMDNKLKYIDFSEEEKLLTLEFLFNEEQLTSNQ